MLMTVRGIFGEIPAEIAEEDWRLGRVRVGGANHGPEYLRSYLQSARVLLDHGRNGRDLEALAMPLVFLQRHTVELMLKWLIDQAQSVGEVQEELHDAPPNWKPLAQNDVARHDLAHLVVIAKRELAVVGFSFPNSLEGLVDEIGGFDNVDGTRWRYPNVRPKRGAAFIASFPDELVIHVARLQGMLEEQYETVFRWSDSSAPHDGMTLSEQLHWEYYSYRQTLIEAQWEESRE